LEAGRSCNRSLWSMSTDFRFGSQALSLKPRSTGQHRGDSPIPSWKLNGTAKRSETASLTLFLNNAGNRAGTASKADRSATSRMGSMTSGFRHFMPAWQSSHALVL